MGIAGVSALALLMMLAALPTGSAAQPPSLEQLLSRAGAYVTRLHQQLSGIVAEETYIQDVRSTPRARDRIPARIHRTLRSDLLLVRPSNSDRYVEFRDVFEVDGTLVRDRKERLTALFLDPTPETRNQLKAIIDESARYNAGIITRNINTPMLALSFLEPERQQRFRFRRARRRQPQELKLEGAERDLEGVEGNQGIDGGAPLFRVTTEMWVIEFQEIERPTIIRTPDGDDFPARGRFWIDPATGAVLMSELVMRNAEMNATITVSYQSEPLLGLQVPIAMQEQYRGKTEQVNAMARYGRFRQFQIKNSQLIRRPPG